MGLGIIDLMSPQPHIGPPFLRKQILELQPALTSSTTSCRPTFSSLAPVVLTGHRQVAEQKRQPHAPRKPAKSPYR